MEFFHTQKNRGGNKAKEDLSAYKVARPNDIVMNSMNILAGAVGLSSWLGAVSPVYYTITRIMIELTSTIIATFFNLNNFKEVCWD